jgi:uncharacterized damage-inducible protein DinB
MPAATIRPAFSNWPRYNQALRDTVAGLSGAQLALRPSPERWPLWATVGHAACQRVFWLCDFAGEPGARDSPFPNAGFDCPGDDDLEHVWSPKALAEALDSTFEIVARCLDSWTLDMLGEALRRPGHTPHTRGSILQRVFAHDVYHIAELNEALGAAGLTRIDLWD